LFVCGRGARADLETVLRNAVDSTDVEFVGPSLPHLGASPDYVLSLAVDEGVVWVGTTRGVLRCEVSTGSIKQCSSVVEGDAAMDRTASDEDELPSLPMLRGDPQVHARVERLTVTDGGVWARCFTGAQVLDRSGHLLADYPSDFSAAELLSGDQSQAPLLSWLFPVDGAGNVFLHWQRFPKSFVYDGSHWQLWQPPEVLQDAGSQSVYDVYEVGGAVLLDTADYLCSSSGRVMGVMQSQRGVVLPGGQLLLAEGVPASQFTAEEFAAPRCRLALIDWEHGGRRPLRATVPAFPGAWRLLTATSGGAIHVCAGWGTGFRPAPVELWRIDLAPEAPSPSATRLELGPDSLPLGPGGTGYVTCLLADARDTLWVGTSHGLAALRGGKVVAQLALAPNESPAPPDPRITADDGLHVTCLAEGADGAIWLGTLRGVASYDGTDVKWYVVDREPRPTTPR
jgi:hypothetical protein